MGALQFETRDAWHFWDQNLDSLKTVPVHWARYSPCLVSSTGGQFVHVKIIIVAISQGNPSINYLQTVEAIP